MTALLKFIHLGTIAVWSAGLIALPFLYRQRGSVATAAERDRLHRLTRFVYVGLTSPAAFLAIASGTVLIFLQTTFLEWFSLKMMLVALLVMLHVAAGLILAHLFDPGGTFSRTASVAMTASYLVLAVAIVWTVLAKPHIDSTRFGPLFAPGALRQVLGETRIPIP